MKLTSSPSVSSSTLTGILPTSKGSVFGCLSFVFRRILCSRSLPTHPFDQLKETDPFENPKSDAPATPNLVARLMGLDSMPESNSQKNFPPILRSKSLNSADCKSEETGETQGQHRRLKASVSFRETPSYFELEDGDFFVLSFENGKRKKKSRVKKAKSEMSGRKDEQRRRRIQIKERPSLKVSEGDNLVLEMENYDGEIKTRNRKKNKEKYLVEAKVETESDETENLSPVSVLGHGLFIGDQEEIPTTSEEETRRSSSTRRKLASELSNLEHPSSDHNNESCSKGDHDQESNEDIEVNQVGLQRKDYHSHQNIEMLDQVCRLAESEMADSEWECKNKVIGNLNKWEVEIGAELGLQIVEQLVYEVVHQLL